MRENVLTDYKAAGPDKKYSKTLRQVKKYTGTVILWIIMLLLTVMVLYPLLFVFTTSFKTYGEFLANPFSISFAHPENYAQAWIDGHFSTYFFNSVLVTGLTVIAKVFMSGLVAYCIAVLKIKGWKIVTAIVMSTMFFTGEITGIPQFLLARELNLLDTIWALIVPGLLGPAGLGVLLGMGYAKKIPKELHEAALLDGAGIFAIFWRIDLVCENTSAGADQFPVAEQFQLRRAVRRAVHHDGSHHPAVLLPFQIFYRRRSSGCGQRLKKFEAV